VTATLEIEEEKKPEKRAAETSLPKEKPNRDKEKPLTCQNYLGFLSEREQKGEIPEECMVCKEIVECMLKKMNA